MKKIFIIIFFINCTGFINAENVITLKDIPVIINKNSIAVKKKKLDLQIKQIDVNNHIFNYFPDLNLGYSGAFDDIFHKDEYTPSHSIFLNSTWDIFKNGDRPIAHAREREEYMNLQMDYENLVQREIYEALNLYFYALKQKIYYITARSNERLSKIQYDYVKLRKDLGRVSDLELINATAEYDNAVYLSGEKELNYEKALSELARKLQMAGIDVSDRNLFNMQLLRSINSGNRDIMDIYSIQKANKNIDILRIEKFRNYKDRWTPSLSVRFDLDWYRRRTRYIYTKESWLNKELGGRIDIGLNFPVFERNVKYNAIKKTALRIEQLELERDYIKETKVTELDELIKDHNNKVKLLPISEKRLESSRVNYNMMNESYRLGITSIIDLYQAEKQFRDFERSYIFLKLDILGLKAKLGNFFNDTMAFLL